MFVAVTAHADAAASSSFKLAPFLSLICHFWGALLLKYVLLMREIHTLALEKEAHAQMDAPG